MKYDFQFYVLNYDFNSKKVIHYNIFNNIRVHESTKKLLKDYDKNQIPSFENFVEELKNIVRWQEWGRREYEISVGDAFTENLSSLEKWDCYRQFEPNAEIVAKYLIENFSKKS